MVGVGSLAGACCVFGSLITLLFWNNSELPLADPYGMLAFDLVTGLVSIVLITCVILRQDR